MENSMNSTYQHHWVWKRLIDLGQTVAYNFSASQRHNCRYPLPKKIVQSRGPWFSITAENRVQWKSGSKSKAKTSDERRSEGNSEEKTKWRNCP